MNQGQKRIQKEYRDLLKNPIENIIVLPNPDNIYEWHYVILGTEKPYNKGYYYGILTLPNDYPYKRLYFVSRNVVICTAKYKTNILKLSNLN